MERSASFSRAAGMIVDVHKLVSFKQRIPLLLHLGASKNLLLARGVDQVGFVPKKSVGDLFRDV